MNHATHTVPNLLVWAILTTLICCLPLGIVSIIHAAKVNSLVAAGDIAGAQNASAAAKKWAIWSAIAGPVLIALYVVFMLVVGGLGAAAGYWSMAGAAGGRLRPALTCLPCCNAWPAIAWPPPC